MAYATKIYIYNVATVIGLRSQGTGYHSMPQTNKIMSFKYHILSLNIRLTIMAVDSSSFFLRHCWLNRWYVQRATKLKRQKFQQHCIRDKKKKLEHTARLNSITSYVSFAACQIQLPRRPTWSYNAWRTVFNSWQLILPISGCDQRVSCCP